MPSDSLKFQGIVKAAKGNGFFEVEIFLDETDPDKVQTMMCQLSGKIQLHHVKIVAGDKVKVEVDAYDMNKGRIVYRERK